MRQRAIRFIVLMGVVSLLSDITYEGARAITGPFLASLSAPAAVVGLVAGFGELVGHGFRLVSGIIADRTGRYWAITIFGYAVNLLAVPALALAGHWPVAAGLMVAERFGKALRAPARDALLSRATSHVGHGWGFGLHEAMDQIGAVTGPLIVAFVLQTRQAGDGYRVGFAWLLVPSLMALSTLFIARSLEARRGELHAAKPVPSVQGQRRTMVIYLCGAALVAASTADFPLIAFHFERTAQFAPARIAMLYALAMGADALAALVFGRWFDKRGLSVLSAAALISAFYAPLAFLGSPAAAAAGVVLWGIGMGAQESILRAAVATLSPTERRGAAYGLFTTVYGVAWFAGSAATGFLYDVSTAGVAALCFAGQLAAVPVFYALRREALN